MMIQGLVGSSMISKILTCSRYSLFPRIRPPGHLIHNALGSDPTYTLLNLSCSSFRELTETDIILEDRDFIHSNTLPSLSTIIKFINPRQMYYNMLYLDSNDRMLYFVGEFLSNSLESSIHSLKIQAQELNFAFQL